MVVLKFQGSPMESIPELKGEFKTTSAPSRDGRAAGTLKIHIAEASSQFAKNPGEAKNPVEERNTKGIRKSLSKRHAPWK